MIKNYKNNIIEFILDNGNKVRMSEKDILFEMNNVCSKIQLDKASLHRYLPFIP